MTMTSTLFRTATLAFGAAAVAVAPTRAQELPPAAEIVAAYENAIGGREAISRATHRHFRGQANMAAAGLTMTVEAWYQRPDRMLMVMDIPGMGEMRQGYDGEVAWSVNPMQGPHILEGAELEQLARQSDFDANLRFDHLFPTMETVGRDEVAGRPCYRVRMVAANGDEAFGCFDVESKLLLGLSARTESEAGIMETSTQFQDYRDFGGVLMPARMVMSTMGQEVVVTVEEMDMEPFADSVFALPAEIQALRQ